MTGKRVYYRALVNGRDTGYSRVFNSDERPGNVLCTPQFALQLEVDEGDAPQIDVCFRAWDKDSPSESAMAEVRQKVRADFKQSLATTAESEKLLLCWRIEPLTGNTGHAKSRIAVARQHAGSTTYSLLAAEKVEIGILVRGCWGEALEPPIRAQHADMTLPTLDGNHRMLVGFFADPRPETLRGRTVLSVLDFDLNEFVGEVYLDDDYEKKRKHYFDAKIARTKRRCSLFCKLDVLASQAKLIKDIWWDWMARPPNFVALGQNCSNRAAIALAEGHVITHIKGLDTPYNLYRTLKQIYGPALECTTGFAGFEGGEYKIVYKVDASDVPATFRDGSSMIDALQ
jgi:hypothetical protein